MPIENHGSPREAVDALLNIALEAIEKVEGRKETAGLLLAIKSARSTGTEGHLLAHCVPWLKAQIDACKTHRQGNG
jgi:hypothetical protein